MKMTYFFKQTHISRRRIVLTFSDLLRQITLCLSSKDESATLKNSDTGAKFLTLFNMNWTLVRLLTIIFNTTSPKILLVFEMSN